ncbi:MAG: flagellar biosynthetic protein FliR, partial [Anaerolineae bacterium]
LYFLAATLLYLVIDGHHALLIALTRAYDTVPLAAAVDLHGSGGDRLVALVSTGLTTGLSIALPVVAVTLILDVALAIVARAVPQVQVFFVGMPIKIGVSLALMALVLPSAVQLMMVAIRDVPRQIDWLLGAL